MARSGDKVREGGDGGTVKRRPAWAAWLMVSGGLGGLIWGGSLFVDGATGVARGLGVSESVIGLTIVAIGTSLPDLAASVAAAVKGSQGLAIGNVVGSCVFNVFLCWDRRLRSPRYRWAASLTPTCRRCLGPVCCSGFSGGFSAGAPSRALRGL